MSHLFVLLTMHIMKLALGAESTGYWQRGIVFTASFYNELRAP
ncbi:hypothetical protein [Paraburkholderia haematera]|nr:hypothetical protein [Paraburkholderia haematera]